MMEQHKHWKHAKTGKLATLIGVGTYEGYEPSNDMAPIVAVRKMDDSWQVVPQHYGVANVKSADAGRLQTSQPLSLGDAVVVYHHGDAVWARREAEFFDGRFVKVDEQGHPLDAPAADPAPAVASELKPRTRSA